jgi:hypothetical protein
MLKYNKILYKRRFSFLRMQHITGISRQQMRFFKFRRHSPDNQVRFIDAFVESIDLSKLGFAVKRSRPKVAQVSIVKYF